MFLLKKTMIQRRLLAYFLIALFYTWLVIPLFGWTFWTFAPFYAAVAMIKKSLSLSLWLAALSGLILDFISTSLPFATHSLIAFATMLLLHRYRRFFFEDRGFSLSFYTALFAFFLTLFYFLTLKYFDMAISITFPSILTDFILMPLLEGLYAFVGFYLPLLAFKSLRLMWSAQ